MSILPCFLFPPLHLHLVFLLNQFLYISFSSPFSLSSSIPHALISCYSLTLSSPLSPLQYFILLFSIIPTTPVITEITTLLYLTIPLTFSLCPPPLLISRHRHRPLAAFLVFIIPIITLIISLTAPTVLYLYVLDVLNSIKAVC